MESIGIVFPEVDTKYYKDTDIGAFTWYYSLMGIIMLLQKYNNVGFPFIVNANEFFTINYDVIRDCLKIPEKYVTHFFHCKSNVNIRFIVGLLNLEYRESVDHIDYYSHCNAILYDRFDNSIELFEPNGPTYRGVYINTTQTTLHINSIVFHEKFTNVYLPHYYNTHDHGLQSIQYDETKTKRIGFCGTWSIWWLNYRFKNAHLELTRKELFDYAIATIRTSDICYTKYLVTYETEILIKWYGLLLRVVTSIDEFKAKLISKIKHINALLTDFYNNIDMIKTLKNEIKMNLRLINHLMKLVESELEITNSTSSFSLEIDYLRPR
jgi:hypothetical protein